MVTLCALSGSAGDTVDCSLRVAASSDAPDNYATAFQGNIVWDNTKLTVDNFYDSYFCPAPCIEDPVGSAGVLPFGLSTGHSLTTSPDTPADWQAAGKVSVVIVNTSNPGAKLTDAYLDASGSVVNDPEFVRLRFTLAVDVPASDPVLVQAEDTSLVLSNAVPQTLDRTVDPTGLIVTTKP